VLAATPQYTLVDVASGTVPPAQGWTEEGGAGINANGWVAGVMNFTLGGTGHAFLWKGLGSPIDLGTLVRGNSGYSFAYNLNLSGTVVGGATSSKGGHAFADTNGTMTDLGALSHSGGSIAADINDGGLVVGQTTTATSGKHAFKYSNGTMTDIGALPGDTLSSAHAVNSTGTIVGRSQGDTDPQNAFVYAGGVMSELPTLSYPYAEAMDVNDSGTIVGESMYGSNVWHAVSWDAGTHQIHDNITPNAVNSEAMGINNHGDIVGMADNRAFLVESGQYIDLTNAYDPLGVTGWTLEEAFGINDNGQIVGVATHNGTLEVFRLSPAPISLTPPGVSGSPVQGSTLTITPGTWEGATTISHQWERCDLGGGSCASIPGATGATYIPNSTDVRYTLVAQESATNSYGSTVVSSVATVPVVSSTLLLTYAPRLMYDLRDSYRADSAAELTDNCDPPSSADNILETVSGAEPIPFASSCQPVGTGYTDRLTMAYLGSPYSTGRPAFDYDRIDESDQYEQDFTRMHAQTQLANQAYGRVVAGPSGTTILQYWFFYYDQPNFWYGVGGAHEGDWEGIQIELDNAGHPAEATYFQHHGGEDCPYGVVTSSGTHPEVFVAIGSHASYFTLGNHPLDSISNDSAMGDGEQLVPHIVDVSASTGQPSWLSWPGHWGGTTSGGINPWDQDSPAGPAQTGSKWNDPATWAAQYNGNCAE
jgi:probable HAF family extracellular repeat protein